MPFYSVLVKENKDYVSIRNLNRLKALKTPRFLKKRIKLIQHRYSEEQLQKLSHKWEPWNHWGKDDKKLIYYKRYGKFGGYAAYFFGKYLYKYNPFRKSRIDPLNSQRENRKLNPSLSLNKAFLSRVELK